MNTHEYALVLSCTNAPGIVAQVSTKLVEFGGDIFEAQQFDDPVSHRFFMRVLFRIDSDIAAFKAAFAQVAKTLDMDWSLRSRAEPTRVLIMVSKFDHCLADLLYRSRIGEMPMKITAIVSNHPIETFRGLDFGDIAFHHLPVTKETKPAQEEALLKLVKDTDTQLVVLARYMQILSDSLSQALKGNCINIHHSFLPSFKGARPYHQAFERGVKVIGATAHYVTPDLDEGPIIEQDVQRISHADTPEALIRKGREIECRVLARAVRYHLEHRIIANDTKTVVFAD
ncbi:MAG: formyltetrahydrofolate deformylase [Sphingomonadales bacterium]|nr:formyltetrahydrofolate deformylase [Sphingomonadales bacterium]